MNGNGYHHEEPAVEDLERMLPDVNEGQVPFGMIVSRVAQQIYAELQEVAETSVAVPLFPPRVKMLNRAHQTPRHVRRRAQAHPRGLCRRDEEAGRQAVRDREVVEGCGGGAESHGTDVRTARGPTPMSWI